MDRRNFIQSILMGALYASFPKLIFSNNAFAASNEDIMAELEKKNETNSCQSVSVSGERESALLEVNPQTEIGILASSIGCKSPHKHLVFLPMRYLDNPSLVEAESDITLPDGTRAKTFSTSHAFEMSFVVKHTVGAHQHSFALTKDDFEKIARDPAGIKKLVMQNKFPFGGEEPGHVFHFARKQG